MANRRLGPGPNAYKLPTTIGYQGHDPSRHRYPQYTIAGRRDPKGRQVGPGPAYRIDKVTYVGPITSPAWSFGSRHPAKGYAITPGPAAHAPERCPPTKDTRAPMYSFGARLQGLDAKRGGPAPNAYLVRTRPAMPAWTMAARIQRKDAGKTPGPNAYYQKNTDVYRERFPAYSLGARFQGRDKFVRTPGPAAYPCFTLFNTKKNPYSYSFGTRHAVWAPPLILRDDEMDCLQYNKPKEQK